MRKRDYNNYKKVYEQHYGKIPKDENGRSYQIHHIDGNRCNDDPSNLVALSIEEHYKIHLEQGDIWAALRLAERMKLEPQVISFLASEAQKKRVADGTHHLLSGEIQRQYQKSLVENGTHTWLSGEQQKINQTKRVREKEHQWTDSKYQSYWSKINNKKRIENGTHNTIQNHTCPHCSMMGKGIAMFRHHFDNCKKKV